MHGRNETGVAGDDELRRIVLKALYEHRHRTLVRFDYALKELSMPFDTIICAITSLVGRRNIGDGLLMAPND